ncbi:hypothetical protein [Pontibacter arcticus]|uniref:Uncharacterized protein n=1 Tax=Pontibacter arcticus TaxID=2080288 RepID=A0A364RFB3_9BACT|nr:hypothetical protein [Pontibacter arcticus]RAU82957.1 hypothetical protein DP923_06870 [Pontibacter arcticus]
MKKLLVIAFVMFSFVTVSSAKNSSITAEQRAKNLSDQMIRELRLNNFQANKVREINLEVADQMLEIEEQYAGDQNKIDELCKNVCSKRDVALEKVLSTVQYNNYFGNRKAFNSFDREFVAKASIPTNNVVAGNEASASIR